MKKFFLLSILVSSAMIWSCQKQDLAAEKQIAQRKAELDEREKALDEREKALEQREKATANARRLPAAAQLRSRSPDAAQVKAERDKRIQQLPGDLHLQGLIADPSRMTDEKARMQERLAQRQRRLEELQKMRMSRKMAPPAAEVASPTPTPAVEATSPSPSPTPE